jgi:hypothetical protein
LNHTISLVSPFIDRWRAARADGDIHEHLRWDVTYAAEAVSTEMGNIWPVFATLHAAGPGGWGDVSVAAFVRNAEEIEPDEFESVLAGSEAIETLYDFARSHFMPLIAGVGAELSIPKKSPDPRMSPYSDDDADEDDGAESAADAEAAE